jgi:hypothetical protein
MIKRPVPLTLTARRTPSKLTYWRTLLLEFAVTGSSLADVDPHVWLAGTPLMRAIGRLLAGSS